MSAKRHQHTFSALYWHFGRYGPQDAHVHSCLDEGCDRVLIGSGCRCSGTGAGHWRHTLGDDPSALQERLERERER